MKQNKITTYDKNVSAMTGLVVFIKFRFHIYICHVGGRNWSGLPFRCATFLSPPNSPHYMNLNVVHLKYIKIQFHTINLFDIESATITNITDGMNFSAITIDR
jgi:hypothetical protein